MASKITLDQLRRYQNAGNTLNFRPVSNGRPISTLEEMKDVFDAPDDFLENWLAYLDARDEFNNILLANDIEVIE